MVFALDNTVRLSRAAVALKALWPAAHSVAGLVAVVLPAANFVWVTGLQAVAAADGYLAGRCLLPEVEEANLEAAVAAAG